MNDAAVRHRVAPVVRLTGISRQFKGNSIVRAVRDVDLRVERGDWLAITGPSGAGKSTLLNILGCLDRPTAGRYEFDGINTSAMSDRQRAGMRARRIGFVFQSYQLLPHLSVLENVMLAEVYRKGAFRGRRERALGALGEVGLLQRADFMPTLLSGGERQRVAIARAIVSRPSLLLADEPTGNLDSRSTIDILDLFERLNDSGLTLIVVTHERDVAERAHRRANMIDGRLTDARQDHTGAGTPSYAGVSKNSERKSSLEESFPRSAMRARDLFIEALSGTFARPARTFLTVLGVIIGLTALVATVGLTRTAGNQIISAFDELAATEIRISARSGPGDPDPHAIPWDAQSRLERLNGVVAAGALSDVDVGGALISSSPVQDPAGLTAFNLSVQAASPGLFAAVRATLSKGRFPDEGHSDRAERVALLGRGAAERLGIIELGNLPAIAVGDVAFLVVGVVDSVAREPELLTSVIIPEGTARRDFRLEGPGTVIAETKIGAAALIARQAPLALRPDDPDALKLQYPAEPKRVREAVQGNLDLLLLLLGGLSLIIGAIGIGNTTLVSVMERTGEIGLRRAIGATRGHIAIQFMLESTAIGAIGGIFGTGIGILVVVAVSAYQNWTPVLDPLMPLVTPLLGALIGLVSGTYPAIRASRMEPVEAIRT